VPTTGPSALLERRPDIAEAERQMKEENSLIGVQVAAYFPTINLSAVFGYAGNPGTALFSTSSEVWTLMASASQSITAQITLLNDQETTLQVQEQRMVASAALVQALGGGWDSSQLPTTQNLQKLHLIPD
jgi:outer membrane protein TolC